MPNWFIRDKIDFEKSQAERDFTSPYTLMLPGDNGAHVWVVSICAGGESVDITGKTVQAFFTRPDGNTVVVEGEALGSAARVTFPRDVYLYRGAVRAVMRLGDSVESVTDPVTTLIERTFYVRDGVGNIVDPATAFPTLAALAEDVAEVEDELDTVESGLSAVQTTLAGAINYTTGETATGGTWIDGKAIYRQVLTGSGSGSSSSITYVNLGSLASTPDTIISIRGIMVRSNGVVVPIPYASPASTNYGVVSIYYDASSVDKHFTAAVGTFYDDAALSFIAIVEYTKATT